MSATLAPGAAPAALVPGDPAGPRALAARLDAYAESAAAAAGQLRSLDAGGWVGEAAEAFRHALAQVPERLERAVDAFAEAASALRAYASVLADAQERARLALARVETAEADTATWRARLAAHDAALAAEAAGGPPAGPAPPSHDPGAPGRSAAEALLDAARADVEVAARAAAERLERAAADAPEEPGFWGSAWHAAGQFLAGAAEASLELGELVFKLNPTYALTNPQGFVEHVAGLGQGVVYAATHRTEFAKAVVNWDLWLDNPARALGQLVPDLVLAVGTGGAGAAARGAARGAARQRSGNRCPPWCPSPRPGRDRLHADPRWWTSDRHGLRQGVRRSRHPLHPPLRREGAGPGKPGRDRADRLVGLQERQPLLRSLA